jgi:hypothetical protein
VTASLGKITDELRLRVTLPQRWNVVQDATWEHASRHDAGPGTIVAAAGSEIGSAGKPHLVASLLLPVADANDELSAVITASLVIECFALTELPSAEAWPPDGHVDRGIEVAPGIAADFYRLTVPVYDAKAGSGAVATFTTPNLPLVPELVPGFRSIAATIRYEPDTTQDQP